MATPRFICAGWALDNTACQKDGRFACKNCLLVVYCGPTCQRSHWTSHKTDCKSYLGKETWQPDWALENRRPAFVRDGVGQQFGGKKYLWGNMPAFDVLELGSNESVDYEGHLNLLFAASGDLRNVVKTIAQLPASYSRTVDVTLNDLDLDIVARNAIMLLIALVVDNTDEAVDCVMHVWYSALIHKSHLEILQQRIRPLVEEVCDKTKAKNPRSLLGKTWKFGRHSLRLVLAQSAWSRLLSYMDVPPGLDAENANRIRRAVTLAEARQDYRDRHLLLHSPSHRIAKHRFRDDGLLLPFGSRRDEFVEPNPTLFQTADAWPLHDNADPLNGWLLKDIDATSSGPATADIYGKLFYHVRGVLGSFLRRLRQSGLAATLRLLQVNALELPDYLEPDESFSRIEVANISDCGYLGPHRTVALMAPLLQEPAMNPHATLITLFMNAVEENMTDQDRMADATEGSQSSKDLVKYIRPTGPLTGTYDRVLIRFSFVRDFVTSYDRYFDRFVKKFRFAELAGLVGAVMKDRHTVIERWPYRLKLTPGQPGAQEEFDRALGGGPSSKERYVEWKRVQHVDRAPL